MLARKNITGSQPIERISVVIRMCRIDWHDPTLARVFERNCSTLNRARNPPPAHTASPKSREKIVRTNFLTTSKRFSFASLFPKKESTFAASPCLSQTTIDGASQLFETAACNMKLEYCVTPYSTLAENDYHWRI